MVALGKCELESYLRETVMLDKYFYGNMLLKSFVYRKFIGNLILHTFTGFATANFTDF